MSGTGLFLRLCPGEPPDLGPLADLLRDRPLATVYVDATRVLAGAVPAALAAVRSGARIVSGAEVTAAFGRRAAPPDPGALREAGVTRVALASAPAAGVVAALGAAGLRVAVDLRPPGGSWAELVAEGAGHLSVEGPDPDAAERLARDIERLGLARYDLWNLARPGEECRHVLDARRGGELLALGPGTAGRVRIGERWFDLRSGRRRPADPLAFAVERVIDGLQLAEGIALDALPVTTGVAVDRLVDPAVLERLVARGWLVAENGRLRIAAHHRRHTDPILVDLLGPALRKLAARGGYLR